MSAVEALQAARNAGIGLHVDGDGLVLEASAPPPDEVFDLLSRQKAGVIAQLKRDRDGWSAEDWQVLFDERAGLIDFDGGLPRAQAEARAFACCLAEWMSRNPAPLPPVRCFGCGAVEHMHDPLLPFGIDSTGHAWLLSRCWPAWYAGRKAETVAALAAMGITAPAELPDDFEKNGCAA